MNFCGAGLTCGTKILSSRLCRLGLRGPEEQAGGLFLPSNGPAGPGQCTPRGAFLRRLACHPGAKMRSLRICRLGFAAPGKQASGLFSARTGRQALVTTCLSADPKEKAMCDRQRRLWGFPKWGSEGPENDPVDHSHRRTGRQAPVVSPFRWGCAAASITWNEARRSG